jgi:hypothetical protein
MDLVRDFLAPSISLGTKILTTILTLFFKVLQEMILTAALEKETQLNMEA